MAELMLHRGGRLVDRQELATIRLPESTKTWHPVAHDRVLDTASQALEDAGYRIARVKLGLSSDNNRFFATLDLTAPLSPDGTVTLAVGLRNSIDKTFPMGFCAGSRVFVCDNLAFRSELLIRRKHTINGVASFNRDIGNAVLGLAQFTEQEGARVKQLQAAQMTDAQAESFILRAAVDRGILNLNDIPAVYNEWKSPRHDEFRERSAWSLFNGFTEVLKRLQDRQPVELSQRTMRLSAMLSNEVSLAA